MVKRLNSVIQDINPVYVPVDSDLLIVRIKTKELVRVLFLFCVLEMTVLWEHPNLFFLCLVLSLLLFFCPSPRLRSFFRSPLRDPVNDLVLCLLIKVRLEYITRELFRRIRNVSVSLTV